MNSVPSAFFTALAAVSTEYTLEKCTQLEGKIQHESANRLRCSVDLQFFLVVAEGASTVDYLASFCIRQNGKFLRTASLSDVPTKLQFLRRLNLTYCCPGGFPTDRACLEEDPKLKSILKLLKYFPRRMIDNAYGKCDLEAVNSIVFM